MRAEKLVPTLIGAAIVVVFTILLLGLHDLITEDTVALIAGSVLIAGGQALGICMIVSGLKR